MSAPRTGGAATATPANEAPGTATPATDRRQADLLIRGALVFDGSGQPPVVADVAVANGRILAVGPNLGSTLRAAETIAAEGLALMPGIIDSHTHFDAQITWDPSLRPSPALGVTTAVIGNCGFTIAPCRPADRELTEDRFFRSPFFRPLGTTNMTFAACEWSLKVAENC